VIGKKVRIFGFSYCDVLFFSMRQNIAPTKKMNLENPSHNEKVSVHFIVHTSLYNTSKKTLGGLFND